MALKKEIFKNLQRKNTFFIIVFSDFTYGEIYKMYLFKAIFTLRENPSAPTVHALPPWDVADLLRPSQDYGGCKAISHKPPYRQYGYIRQAMSSPKADWNLCIARVKS